MYDLSLDQALNRHVEVTLWSSLTRHRATSMMIADSLPVEGLFLPGIEQRIWYYRLMVVWTWTQNPNCVQSLSRFCPISVDVQIMSNHCPRQVQTLSTLCRFSRRMDIVWTSKSRVCPGSVQTRRHLEIIRQDRA